MHTVAPRVGAWIETWRRDSCSYGTGASHLVWVRGLKRNPVAIEPAEPVSHLVWVRGLKRLGIPVPLL
ncbi:MAG: hypothetical protein U0O08_09910, partial [Parabacteroides distasonis]